MKHTLYPLLLCAVVTLFSCQKDSTEIQPEQEIERSSERKKNKVTICHKDGKVLSVNENAVANHLAHGDVILDADNDGFYVDNNCGFGPIGDCDDNDPAVHPDAIEDPTNEIDDNCDGEIDEVVCETEVACLACGEAEYILNNIDLSTFDLSESSSQLRDGCYINGYTGTWLFLRKAPEQLPGQLLIGLANLATDPSEKLILLLGSYTNQNGDLVELTIVDQIVDINLIDCQNLLRGFALSNNIYLNSVGECS